MQTEVPVYKVWDPIAKTPVECIDRDAIRKPVFCDSPPGEFEPTTTAERQAHEDWYREKYLAAAEKAGVVWAETLNVYKRVRPATEADYLRLENAGFRYCSMCGDIFPAISGWQTHEPCSSDLHPIGHGRRR